MKKIISLLLTVVFAFSAFATVAFAEDVQVFNMVVSDADINVGDTFTVTINLAKQRLASWAANIKYDIAALKVESFVNSAGQSYDYYYINEDEEEFFADWSLYNSSASSKLSGDADLDESRGVISFYGVNTSTVVAAEKAGYAVITFKALTAGTPSLVLTEGYDYTATASNGGGTVIVDPRVVQTETITVAGNEPEDTITNDETPAEAEATDGTKRMEWDVAVTAGLVQNNKLEAVLTHPTEGTQNVAITFAENLISGAAEVAFKLSVKFQDWAKAAATTLVVREVE